MQKRGLSLLLCSVSLMALSGSVQLVQRQLQASQSAPVKTQSTLRGEAIAGTTLTTVDEQGRTLTLNIRDVEVDPTDLDREVYLYTLFYQNATTSQWQNLCQPDRNGVAKAIPLAGQWDKTGAHLDNGQITVACTSSVLAKCVRLGYKPWKIVNGQSLRNYHQACTRMLRADYCGNGIAHTQEGTPIDIYDRLNIQQPIANNDMVFEAAWSPEGAVWLNHTRHPATIAQLQRECPEKLQAILHENEEAIVVHSLAPNALLFNRSLSLSAN
jgi:hypothetical protein